MEVKLKKGDIVTNTTSIRDNPVVCESRGWSPIERGGVGVVLEVRQTDLNSTYSKDGKGDVYVDVLMSTEAGPWRAGNYLQGCFQKVVHATTAEA